MIIGHGDIATILDDTMIAHSNEHIFFASGVSNSQETDELEYKREIQLLLQQDESKHLVYFSSLSVFYTESRYAEHKEYMESLIKAVFPHYTIIRLGNILWGKNPHTFINAYKIKPYEIKNEYRFVVDEKEFLYWIDLIPEWNCEMNIPGRMMKVKDILKKYGHIK